jgi:hypothetical protein
MPTIRTIRRIGAAAVIVPTIDHLIAPIITIILAPALMSEVFGAGAVAAVVFFVCLGLFQLVWIGVLLRSSNRILLIVGILGNLVSIVIYFVSLSGVTIFGVPPQNGGAFALLIKGLEALFVFASIDVLRRLAHIETH